MLINNSIIDILHVLLTKHILHKPFNKPFMYNVCHALLLTGYTVARSGYKVYVCVMLFNL